MIDVVNLASARRKSNGRFAPSLVQRVDDGVWTLIPDLQGRKRDLMVGLSYADGALTAVAQWSSGKGRQKEHCMKLARDPEHVARLLTIALAIVEAGLA